jgi:hypothetical protein
MYILCFLFPNSDISNLLWHLLYTPTNTFGVIILWWGFWIRLEFSFTIFIHNFHIHTTHLDIIKDYFIHQLTHK